MTPTSVLLHSGGLDSTALLYHLVKTQHESPLLLTFDYGQRHGLEIGFSTYHADLLGVERLVVDVKGIFGLFNSALCGSYKEVPEIEEVLGDPQPITYVPFRNAIFLMMGCGVAESREVEKVYYGAQENDLYSYWDTTSEFVMAINWVTTLNRKCHIEVLAPLAKNKKRDNVSLGKALGIDFTRVLTCYHPDTEGRACGVCPSCSERLKAFADLNLKDPFPYQV